MIWYLWPGSRPRPLVAARSIPRGADVSLILHRAEHLVAPLPRRPRVEERVVFGGRLGKAGDHRRLGQVEFFGRFVEVGLRRRLGADRGAAFDRPVGRGVEVGGEDPFLRVGFLLLVGQVGFDDLPLDRLFRVLDVEVADQLLGDGRRALHGLAAGKRVLPGGADDPGVVERAVVEVVLVLDRDRRVLEVLRQRLRGDRLADAARLDEADQAAVGGVDRRGASVLDRFQAR